MIIISKNKINTELSNTEKEILRKLRDDGDQNESRLNRLGEKHNIQAAIEQLKNKIMITEISKEYRGILMKNFNITKRGMEEINKI